MYSVEKEGQLTLFPPGTREHASLLVMPGSEKARMTTVTSGLKCSALYKSSRLSGLLVKMLLGTLHWASMMSYLTWTVSDTPQKRLLFRLVASTPHTEESAFSLWPTPTSTCGDGRSEQEPKVWQARYDRTLKEKGIRNGMPLNVAVKMWPTPKATLRGDCPAERNRRSPDLHSAVKMYQDRQEGQLNPEWVETLMGFPQGWTEITGQQLGVKSKKNGSHQELQPASKTGTED